jgi:hypothetical protein
MTRARSSFGKLSRQLLLALALIAASAPGAVLYTESFSSLSGWIDRDPGEMGVTYQSGVGDPAGSLRGQFAYQPFQLIPQTDAFRASTGSSGGSLTGDYYTEYPTVQGLMFDFMADDVLPSDLMVRFSSDGTNFYTRTVTSWVPSVDQWYTVRVPLTYSGWFGGTEAGWSNTLANVRYIDVQVTRNGQSLQRYYLDNFTLSNDYYLFAVIPEPNHLGLLALAAWGLASIRRVRRKILD